ncbi:alpha/beta hydrolase [Staphylococcus sp. 17KM0847]|uniref:alpha/beta hydrolase n=1 Tax=Staphylococcus sp. 17KM0847 TaxID=2583989 RepID=UPI0015DDF8BE|nr:alpha/beta hydrolase [Staphylococcus sp. 17KM0847]
MEHVTIFANSDYQLHGTLYRAAKTCHRVMIYFHGGGFIFGQRDDLPDEYVDVITRTYHLLTVDYRLLPESSWDDIVDDLKHINAYVSQNFKTAYCMGRSAGGFLALTYATLFDIAGVIDFYGFYNLSHSAFYRLPTNHQNIAHMLSGHLKHSLIKRTVTTNEPPQPRFLLYLYYRERGIWPSLIHYNISNEQLKKPPKLFIAHAINDPDVPIAYSIDLANIHNNAKLVKINSHIHDFDSEVTEANIQLYEQACEYIL